MILAMDLGNTSLTAGVWNGERFFIRFKVPVGRLHMLWDDFQRELGDKQMRRTSLAVLSSVNPSGGYEVEKTVGEWLPVAHFSLIGRDMGVPVKALVDHPEKVGTDRLLAAYAAFRRVKGACIVVGIGTAITVDAVSAKGEFLGGVIAPGVRTSAWALHNRTALLPEVEPRRLRKVTGRNTDEAVASGIYFGTIAMVEGLVARMRREHRGVKKVLATGGDAKLIASKCANVDRVVPDLVLEGIVRAVEAENPEPRRGEDFRK